MSKPVKNSATCADSICLSVLNPDSKPAANQPVFYLGEAAALNVRLVNATGSDLALKGGAALDIFFLSLDVNLVACKIDLPGWALTPKQYSLDLAYTAGSPAIWGQGEANALAFQITGVQSSLTQAAAGFLQISFSGFSGSNIPARLKMPLGLIAALSPGKADLDIAVGLADGGIIYVPQPGNDPVTNKLLLNVVNMGKEALFTGTPGHRGNPDIKVSFVYGSTAGALAPDADKNAPQAGSAWNIKGKEAISEGNDWAVTNPDSTAKPTDPVWVLQPDQTNSKLIGTGDSAAIQFEFDEVISQLPGVTLMSVLFTGFQKDDRTSYNDRLFIVPISKEYLPAPGLIRFSSQVTKISIHSTSQEVSIPLFWRMTGVSKIVLESSSTVTPNIPDVPLSYPSPQPPLQYGQYVLKFQGVELSGSLLITCRAYDVNNNPINDLQQIIEFDFPPIVTAYTGELSMDGKMLLRWKTEGAMGVTIFSTKYDANGSVAIPLPSGQPLLNNPYYALIANGAGPGENSGPCMFQVQKFGSFPGIDGAGESAACIAASPKGDYVFVANSDNDFVSAIDTGNGPPFTVVAPEINVGNQPYSIAVSPKGDFAFTGNLYGANLSVIDVGNGPPFKVLPQAIGVGNQPWGLAFSPKGDYAFVSNSQDNTVSVIDVGNGPPFSVLSTIGVGKQPQSIAVSPKGDYVFVPNYIDHSVSVIDIRNGPPFNVLPTTIGVGTQPIAVAFSPKGDFAFVANVIDNTVSAIDVRSGPPFKVLSTINVGGQPSGVGVDPGGNHVYVSNSVGRSVSVIEIGDGPTFKVVPPDIDVVNQPQGLAVSPTGDYAFVAKWDGESVAVVGLVSVSAF